MSNAQLDVEIGFPKFRSHVYAKYSVPIQEAVKLSELASVMFKKPVSEPLHQVIGRIASIVTNSLGAVVLLVLNGYGHDAMRIVRSMFEGAVTVAFLKRHPEQFQDYWAFRHIRRKRSYNVMLKHFSAKAQKISPEKVAQMEQHCLSVVNQFKDKRGKVRHRWSSVGLAEMAKEVGMEWEYRTVYSWTSSMLHVDIGALSLQADPVTKEGDAAPSQEWLGESLITAHRSVLQVLDNYNEIARLGFDTEIQTATDGFMTAWKKNS